MEPIHLFDLAGRQARWLSTDQSVIASNVANASTPGYRAQSVQPFSEVLDKTELQLASTDPEPPRARPDAGPGGRHQGGELRGK